MKLSESLRQEVNQLPSGVRDPQYFRFLGYREHLHEPIALLRAYGIEALFTKVKPHIYVHDLIVGSTDGLYCEISEAMQAHAKNLVGKIGGRMFRTNADHYAPNYRHVLAAGVPGLLKEIQTSQERYRDDEKRSETLRAMRIALEGFGAMIGNYAKEAERLKSDAAYDAGRLAFVEQNCRALLTGRPETFAQGLQLIWFCHTAFKLEGRAAMAIGRLDQDLYPLYRRDMDRGCLTREQAVELLENMFTKIPTNDVVNICIGGMNAEGVCQINELSSCIVDAVRNCNAPGPNLSARITADTPDEFLLQCLKSIGTGLGYPALMNDTVNIAALRKQGYEEADVYNYCMVGCIENFITGMQPPWSDGRFDTPRYFDYIFNRGESAFNHSVGLDTGALEDIASMEAFMAAYESQLRQGVAEYCAMFHATNDSINQEYYAEPFLSCFCEDCIGRGLDINNGGSKYPSVHGAALMGIGTVADSLAAIEKVVFGDKAATLTELRDALNSNFVGWEELHRRLLAAPKYGNNDNFVDKYAVWFVDFLSEAFSHYRTRDGGRIYVAIAANISNIGAGASINATPDGRCQGEPLSDAASPTYGRDTRGVTATLNSVTKPDYTQVACGTVVNQKFSPSMFEGEKLQKLLALVKTYFKKGGHEIQINATSREVLLDAMEHPEKYPTLVVRVSGFSDYYVRLSRAVQLDILNRTQQG